MAHGTVGADLSARARHVIETALYGIGTAHRAALVGPMTRRVVRAALRMAASARERSSILEHLILQPHCGEVTAREILDWIGIEDAEKRGPPHTCVCKRCGKSLERTLTDAALIAGLQQENASLKRQLRAKLREA